ncbi:PP2C family protein-serine/threonine phosphatase, partial [Kibdelosporangium lantanae]
WARAGHPPPILVRDGKAELLPVLRGTMLGVVAEAEYVEDQVVLQSEDMLLLYTDGLVERKDRPIDDALDELLRLIETATGPLEQQLDYLLRYNNANTDDDTCAVAIRLN